MADFEIGVRRCAAAAGASQVHLHGLRYVEPYLAASVHWPKDAHVGHSLAQTCTEIFGGHGSSSHAHWTREILAGRVQLKRKRRRLEDPVPSFETVPPAELLDRQCQIKQLRHVHERVVTAVEPRVLWEDDDMLIVDKPAGLPTQDDIDGCSSVAGAVKRLRPELTTLRPAHRLDIGVSGVLVLAKGEGE